MEKSKLTGQEIVDAIRAADQDQIKQHYYMIIKTMQERMSQDQEAFK